MSMPPTLKQLAVPVADLDRATAFYRDVIGLPLLFNAPNVAFFELGGGARLMLGPGHVAAPQHGAIAYLAVHGIEQVHARWLAGGATDIRAPAIVARTPAEVWIGFVADPDGNTLGLVEEREP